MATAFLRSPPLPPVKWIDYAALSSNPEAGAVFLGDVLIGVGQVGDFHRGGIPFDRAPGADGNVAQEAELGQFRGDVPVRAGDRAALAGADPFREMSALDPWDRLRGQRR